MLKRPELRTLNLKNTVLLPAALHLLALLTLGILAFAQPCTSASAKCTDWVRLGSKGDKTLVYTTYPLAGRNTKIKRAFILVHGAGRNADDYFKSAVAAAFLADALDDTIVISPRLASNGGDSCKDPLEAGEINWNCDFWRSGGPSQNAPDFNSFDLMDELLRKLSNKDVFPSLTNIVVSGHSAGGQYVTRYGMVNTIHEKIGTKVSYIVSNPSSYAYPDSNRPAGSSGEQKEFSDSKNCTTYNKWPYGLADRFGYSTKVSDEQIRKQLAERTVIYLLGGLDTLPIAGFDGKCPAMAQGSSRLERGQAFSNYVIQKYGARHRTVVVPLCGHNARCMFTDNLALPLVFPKQ